MLFSVRILTLLLPAKFDRYIVSWLIGDRGRALMCRSNIGYLMASELSDADPKKMKITIDGDDHVLYCSMSRTID